MGEMHADDMDLVREFAVSGSEAAFATLVRRHVNLVYSAALRRLGNAPEAEEVAQIVFIILARKARGLRRGTILSGWLYQTAQLTATNFQRAAIRRQHREQEAFMQFSEQSEPNASWHRLSPLLEEAMARLGQKERDAIVLRFFENRTVREVAVALGLREDAAQKRVNRATDKLRDYFVRRGVQVSTAVLLASLGTHAVQAAPAELASKIAATAALKGAVSGGSTLTLIKGALKLMAWIKAKTAIVACVTLLLATGTTTFIVKEIINRPHILDESVWNITSVEKLNRLPATLMIRQTPGPAPGGISLSGDGWKLLERGMSPAQLLSAVYRRPETRMVIPTDWPEEHFDVLNTFAEAGTKLRDEVEKRFGLVAHLETRETDVLLLKVKSVGLPGLHPNNTGSQAGFSETTHRGEIIFKNLPPANLASRLEGYFGVPILDRTGLPGRFDIDLRWNQPVGEPNRVALRQAVEGLGLELVPSREPVEMLVVEKVK